MFISRRRFVSCLTYFVPAGVLYAEPVSTFQRVGYSEFDRQLNVFGRNIGFVTANRRERNDRLIAAEIFPEARAFSQFRPSEKKISDRARSLIIAAEVGSAAKYQKSFSCPTWPGGKSGI